MIEKLVSVVDPEESRLTISNGQGMCEDICFYLNDYRRVNSTEEYFNNQMEKMSHSVDLNQPASPATLSLLSWLMNKVQFMGAEMKIIQGLIVVRLPGTTWLWLLRELNMLIAESTVSPLGMAQFLDTN